MADLRGFDANQVEPSADFEPIPAGKYEAVITESEMKPTKAGTGHYLQLTFQVVEGEFKNRLLWARLNLDNPNATAVQIARAELSAICRAVRATEGRRLVAPAIPGPGPRHGGTSGGDRRGRRHRTHGKSHRP